MTCSSQVYRAIMCDADLSHESNMRDTTLGEFEKNLRDLEDVEADHLVEPRFVDGDEVNNYKEENNE